MKEASGALLSALATPSIAVVTNGPEFIAAPLQEWLTRVRPRTKIYYCRQTPPTPRRI